VQRTLAAAYAESAQFDEAIETAKRVAAMARATAQDSLASSLEKDVDLYRDKSALRDFNLTDLSDRR
jgi:hypothetical protein